MVELDRPAWRSRFRGPRRHAEGPSRALRCRRPGAPRLRRHAAADRRGTDDLTALHRGGNDRGAAAAAVRPGAGDRHGLRICRRRPRPRSPPRSTPSNASSGWRSRHGAGSQELGFANVHVRHGDGSLGWPEHAPYDAIVVTAGGPDVPRSLLRQMAVGGRLVMPVGAHDALATAGACRPDRRGDLRPRVARGRRVRAAHRRGRLVGGGGSALTRSAAIVVEALARAARGPAPRRDGRAQGHRPSRHDLRFAGRGDRGGAQPDVPRATGGGRPLQRRQGAPDRRPVPQVVRRR